jgi:hypothetical protein
MGASGALRWRELTLLLSGLKTEALALPNGSILLERSEIKEEILRKLVG